MTADAARRAVFVDADAVHKMLQQGRPPILLDIRFRHGQHDRRFAYLDGHIPGAIYVDLQHDLAGEPGGTRGNRPLPTLEALQRGARAWGLRQDSEVVVYDDDHGLQAGRAWWTLRWGGVQSVRLLDGGLDAWVRAGLPLSTEIPTPVPGDIVLGGGGLPLISADEAVAMVSSSALLDSRGTVNYRGRVTPPGEPGSGHIPGAINLPTPENLDDLGMLRDADALRQRFNAVGVDGSKLVGVYCGGGVSAAHQIAVLATLGIAGALYPGSWSAWSADPARPVVRGPEPWGDL